MANEAPDVHVLTRAAQAVERLEPFRDLFALAPELRKLGGIENAFRESEARLAAAKAAEAALADERERATQDHEAAVKAKLDETDVEAARRLGEADSAVAAKHAAADNEIAAKHAAADKGVKSAAGQVEAILAEAHDQAEKIKSDAHAAVAEQAAAVEAHRAALAGLKEEIATAKRRRDEAERRADSAEAEATTTESRRQKAQEDLAAIRASLQQ